MFIHYGHTLIRASHFMTEQEKRMSRPEIVRQAPSSLFPVFSAPLVETPTAAPGPRPSIRPFDPQAATVR